MLHISNKSLQSEKTHRKWRSCFQQGNQNKHCQPEQQIWSVHNCHLNTLYSTRLPILNMVVITHKKKVQREEIWHTILIFFTLSVTSNKSSKKLEDHLPNQLCHSYKHHALKYSNVKSHQQAGKRTDVLSKQLQFAPFNWASSKKNSCYFSKFCLFVLDWRERTNAKIQPKTPRKYIHENIFKTHCRDLSYNEYSLLRLQGSSWGKSLKA